MVLSKVITTSLLPNSVTRGICLTRSLSIFFNLTGRSSLSLYSIPSLGRTFWVDFWLNSLAVSHSPPFEHFWAWFGTLFFFPSFLASPLSFFCLFTALSSFHTHLSLLICSTSLFKCHSFVGNQHIWSSDPDLTIKLPACGAHWLLWSLRGCPVTSLT